MKKTIILLGLMLTFNLIAFAKHVDEDIARNVGLSFLITQTNLKSSPSLELVYDAQPKNSNPNTSKQPTTFFYVFNTNNQGFVIVSGDDNVIPILAYSDEGMFDPDNIPPSTSKWLEGYKNQIRFSIENDIQATDEISTEWKNLKEGNISYNSARAASSVNPLMTTKWNQSPYYNALCPSGTVTGCVATAMAQIMKYWNYPATGSGFHSYNHPRYGTLSANFGSTTYQWGAMPNTVSSSNSAVATLMYQVGVSVDMNYGIASAGGSGAYVISAQSPVLHCSEYALKTYFGYKNTLQGVQRKNYSQSQWLNILKTEIDASRPVLYAGFGSGGGHCFVADGYDNNDFFHFNWGWGGSYDGYFQINALNPSGTGTGGGTGGYNTGHQALIGIEPPQGTTTYDMRLYSSIVVNPNPINYNSGFSVTVNVANYGTNATNNFSGDYCAAIFNSSNQFVAYIETKTGQNLNFNNYYTNPLVFTTNSIPELTPGDYTIGIYYKPTGSTQWTAFAKGNYQNFIPIKVQGNNTNSLKLYASIVTSPSIIVQNQTFTINFDLANLGSSAFTGDVSVDIHKSDGTWIRELAIKNNLSLPSNTHFSSGLTYTIANGINDEPGTYQLFVWNKPDGKEWDFVGDGNFSNPITIQVVAPSLSPDTYEINNTVAQAYILPISFSGNTATQNTVGSNIHIGTDNDYYKIKLPTGYDYTITARLNDSYNSGNENVYSVDALFSYSTDGTSWSDAYDDIMPGNIEVRNGGEINFHVAPYFSGETGTYLMDVTISRKQNTVGVKEIKVAEFIKAYPNPANEYVNIDLNQLLGKVSHITLLNIQGQEVKSMNVPNSQSIFQLPLLNYPAGVYNIQIHSTDGIFTKKIIINR